MRFNQRTTADIQMFGALIPYTDRFYVFDQDVREAPSLCEVFRCSESN